MPQTCLKEHSVQETIPSLFCLSLNVNPLFNFYFNPCSVLILPLTKLCMSTLGSPHPLPAASRGAFKPCAHALSSCNRQSQYVTSQAPDLPVLSPPTCSLLQPEFWGLSSDSLGCRPCNCDFGVPTATDTRQGLGIGIKWQESGVDSPSLPPCLLRCSAGEGLCPCSPHLCGRRCHELQSGHFCAALDQATAEAELDQVLQPADPQLPVSVQEG